MHEPLPPLPAGTCLVVDAMNVIGSRPDGWWRDRAAAVRRLAARLEVLAAAHGADVVLCVDGERGRGWAPPPGRIEVRHAGGGRGAADDDIVEVVAAHGGRALVVTADRELRARVQTLGAGVAGPNTLLEALAALDAGA